MRINNIFRFYFNFFFICSSIFLISSCATTIPDTDTISPEITLSLIGPGIGTQRMTNPPNSNWTGPSGSQLFDLLPATNYSFTLSVSDQGGVAHASLNLPRELSVLEVSPAEVSTSSDALTTTLTLSGDRDDPRTGLVMSGRLRTPDLGSGNGLSFEFKTEGRDFGGRSGASPNDRFMRVNASVGLPI